MTTPLTSLSHREHQSVVEHVGDIVEGEVPVVLPDRKLAEGQDPGIDGGEARRVQQLDDVHEDGQHDHAAERRPQMLRRHDRAHARVDPRPRRCGNRQRGPPAGRADLGSDLGGPEPPAVERVVLERLQPGPEAHGRNPVRSLARASVRETISYGCATGLR
jgi:hypothetical protein